MHCEHGSFLFDSDTVIIIIIIISIISLRITNITTTIITSNILLYVYNKSQL